MSTPRKASPSDKYARRKPAQTLLRQTDDDRALLRGLAATYGVSVVSLVQMLVNKELLREKLNPQTVIERGRSLGET